MPIAAGSYPYPGAPSRPTGDIVPTRVPEEVYQRISTTPEMFGAQVGAQQERLGQIGMQASEELAQRAIARQGQYNAIVSDDTLTKFNNDADQLLYTGPDALFKKRGEDYMKAHDSTLAALQQLRRQYQSQLNVPQQLQFNAESRGYLVRETRIMGARFDEAQKEYGQKTNNNIMDLAGRDIARAPEDETVFNQARERIRDSAIKNLDLMGMRGSANDADALAKADSFAWHQRIEALLLTNSTAAEAAMRSAPPGTFTADDIYRYQYRLDAAEARAQRAATKAAIGDATRAIMGGGSYAEGGGAERSQPTASKNLENFNFGNMKAAGGGWRVFANEEEGAKAIGDWLLRHNQEGQKTIRQLIDDPQRGYAPSADPGNAGKALPEAAARIVRVGPDTPVDMSDPALRRKMVGAIVQQEFGDPQITQRALAAYDRAQGKPSETQVAAATPSGAAPIVPAAATGRPPVAEPIPTAPQPIPAAPVDKLRPDFESMEERAYTIENEDVRRGVLTNLQRAKSQWSLATATDRKQTVQDVNNTIRQRMIGQDVPDIDEKRIRHLFPQDQADDMVEKMGDAKIYGDTLNRVNTQTLSEIVAERARLAAARGVPGIHDIQVRAQGATDYDKASEAVIKGMQADPAAQMVSRPELRDLATALGQLQPPATDADLPAYQQAHERYANSMLAAQQTWGLPAERSHVLSLTQAQGLASQLTADPAGAPKLMAGMEREWGSAWPAVWHDLVSLAKLPAEFQAVGIIDTHSAMRLAQGLRDEQGGEGEKEKGTAVWDKLFGAQRVSGTSGVIPSVRAQMDQFLLSMNSGGATGPEMDGVLHAVDTLAFSLMAHEPGITDTQAVSKAVTAFTGLYEYMPNGGARVPKAQFDNVTRAAAATIAELTPDWVQIPQGFSGTHGEPTTADYIAAIKGSPVWINGHEGVDLIDNGGRRVRGRDGKPMHIPFDVPAPVGGPADLGAGYAVPVPPM